MIAEVIVTKFSNDRSEWKELKLELNRMIITHFIPDMETGKRRIYNEEFFNAKYREEVMRCKLSEISSMSVDIDSTIFDMYESYATKEYKYDTNGVMAITTETFEAELISEVKTIHDSYGKATHKFISYRDDRPKTHIVYSNTYNQRHELVQTIETNSDDDGEIIYTFFYPVASLKNPDKIEYMERHGTHIKNQYKMMVSEYHSLNNESSTIYSDADNIIIDTESVYSIYMVPNANVFVRVLDSKKTMITEEMDGNKITSSRIIKYKSEIYLGNPSSDTLITTGRVKQEIDS